MSDKTFHLQSAHLFDSCHEKCIKIKSTQELVTIFLHLKLIFLLNLKKKRKRKKGF